MPYLRVTGQERDYPLSRYWLPVLARLVAIAADDGAA
jgi:hypothetical protein